MPYRSGRHFLQIPGPTNVPDRVLRAIDAATMDHRGPEFGKMGLEILEGLKTVFQTKQPVVIFPASGTGAWEAALVNTLSPGDRVLMFETGHFASLWNKMATKLGISVDLVSTDWRRGVDPAAVEAKLKEDREHRIKAVCVVHNETSTGVTSRIGPVRRAIDAAKHPALYMVDTISSLASIDYRHDEWGVDVTVAGSQKGLMLPPGLSFNAVSEKATVTSTPRSEEHTSELQSHSDLVCRLLLEKKKTTTMSNSTPLLCNRTSETYIATSQASDAGRGMAIASCLEDFDLKLVTRTSETAI